MKRETCGKLEYTIIDDSNEKGLCGLYVTAELDGVILTEELSCCATRATLEKVIGAIVKSDIDKQQIMYLIEDIEY